MDKTTQSNVPSMKTTTYSAEISITLTTHNHHQHHVAQLGPGFLILHKPSQLPPGPAILALHVQPNYHSYRTVILPNGASTTNKRITFSFPHNPPRKTHRNPPTPTTYCPPTS